jgi:hypothetical protein
MTNSRESSFITVVSGLPRSGTSMMMRMLEAGGLPTLSDHTRRPDDDNPRGYYELEAVKRLDKDASWLSKAEGKAIKVIYRLLYDLPADYRYRVVFMQRNLDEVISSQKVMLTRNQRTGSELGDQVLASAFRKEIDKVEAWMQTHDNLDYLMVHYNETVADPHRAASGICRFLKLDLDLGKMAAIVDEALYRQRKV